MQFNDLQKGSRHLCVLDISLDFA